MTAAFVDVRAVSKTFGVGAGAVRALDEVSVGIRENEFFTLLGPSGCGKTTLLRLIAGFELPTGGEIHLDGKPLGMLPPHRRPVNTVFQSYALFPHMDAAANIGFGLEMLGWPSDKRERRVREMLRTVKLEECADRRPGALSGGQQQRVALARALAPMPKVLLLDEPLSALDLKLRKEMQIELKRLQREMGITFVFVTHDQEEALTMSDRVAVMKQGRILQVGTPHDIYERPTMRFVADFIGETNFLTGAIEKLAGTSVLALGHGGRLALSGDWPADQRVLVAIRPEQVTIEPANGSGIIGRLEQQVYFGTDIVYLVSLASGESLKVRVQNREGDNYAFVPGDAVRVVIPPGAVKVLEG